MADSAKKKRPAPEAPPGNPLATLADQISYFEELAESQGNHQEAKKPAKVHSLTQNTTHRKIRVGPQYQAALPPCPPQPKK